MRLQGSHLKEEFTTQVKIDGFTEAWEALDGNELSSTEIKVGGSAFQMRLGRISSGTDPERAVSLFLYRVDTGVNPVNASMEVSLKKSPFQTWARSFEKHYWFVAEWAKSASHHHINSRGWQRFCSETELLAHVELNGDDTAQFDVKISTACPDGMGPPDHASCLRGGGSEIHQFPLSVLDFVTLSASEDFQISVPRAMLCAHSSVLKAALESGMTEGRSNTIELPDVRRRPLEDFASCLFSGGLPGQVATSVDRLLDILILADRYDVAPLAAACVWSLSVAASDQNVSRLLRSCELHGLTRLYRVLVHFTKADVKRIEAVMNSDEYSELGPDTVRELFAQWLPKLQAPVVASKDSSSGMHAQAGPHGGALSPQNSVSGAEDGEVPPFLQWGNVEREFSDKSDWQQLHANELRRACFERELATTGTAEELASRLGTTVAGTCHTSLLSSADSVTRSRQGSLLQQAPGSCFSASASGGPASSSQALGWDSSRFGAPRVGGDIVSGASPTDVSWAPSPPP